MLDKRNARVPLVISKLSRNSPHRMSAHKRPLHGIDLRKCRQKLWQSGGDGLSSSYESRACADGTATCPPNPGVDLGVRSKAYLGHMRLTISKLATAAEVPPDTIRYYERTGLLPPTGRSASGYRLYGEQAVERLRFIRGAQRVGLRLREIRELLEISDRGLCPCGHTEELVRLRLAELKEEIDRLSATKTELLALLERFPSDECPPDAEGWAREKEFHPGGRR